MTAFREEQPLIVHFDHASTKEAYLLGEKAVVLMHTALSCAQFAKVPDAFVITTELYDTMLQEKELRAYIKQALKQLDIAKAKSIKIVSRDIRKKLMGYEFSDKIEQSLIAAFHSLEKKSKAPVFSLAIRPSVYGYTNGTLVESIHHSSLCIRSEKQFLRAIRLGIVSLFSEPALLYREAQGIDHRAVKIALLVQPMIGSGKSMSGTVLTAPQKNTMHITASYGLPTYRSKQSIISDIYSLFKPALHDRKSAIIKKVLGSKRSKIKQELHTLKEIAVPLRDRQRFCLSDTQIDRIAQCSLHLEDAMGAPLFVEWVYDEKNMLHILNVQKLKKQGDRTYVPETYELKRKGEVLLNARSLGTKIVSGQIFVLRSSKHTSAIPEQAIVVAKSIHELGNVITKKIKAIIVEESTEHNYALQLARELDIPVMFGAKDAKLKLKNGIPVTLDCTAAGEGTLYKGYLPFEAKRVYEKYTTPTKTKLFTHVGDANNADTLASLPVDGVAVVDQDSIIKKYLRIHPLALVDSSRITQVSTKRKIAELTHGYESRADYAVHKLAEGIAEVAAAFYPVQVVLRMSQDTSQYAELIGAHLFSKQDKHEWQGASRYYSKWYRQAFALECRAIKKAREEWGLSNIEIVIPYCRTPEEGKKVLEFMETCGLKQGEGALKIQVSCDIPSNLILAEEYAKLFDGLTLGSYAKTAVDSADEHDNPVIRQMLKEVIALAHKHSRPVSYLDQHNTMGNSFVEFLVQQGIDRVSVDTDHIVSAREQIAYIERTVGNTGHATGGKFLSLVIGCAVLAAGLINLGAGCSVIDRDSDTEAQIMREVTPAEIRAQVTKEINAQKDAERIAGRSKLKISTFVPLELMYPSGWNVEYWNDGVTLASPTDPQEYVSIFRQIISHPISYESSTVASTTAQKASAQRAGTTEKIDIVEFPLGIKDYVIEINGHSALTQEMVNSITLTDNLNTKVNPLFSHWDIREKRLCQNMAVFARPNKESGVCSLYTNPCDVPKGWQMCGAVDK